MLDDLKPLTLGEAARQIGVDPFEVVRLLVLRGESASLRVPQSKIQALREFAGVELWWTPETPLPEDTDIHRARARAALGMLIERGHIGDALTRLDNLWRGLPPLDQGLLDGVIHALAGEELVRLQATEQGLKVAVVDETTAERLREMVDTGSFSESVSSHWERR